MTATLLDGRAMAEEIRAALKVRAQRLIEHGVQPALAAVWVGDDPASQVYVGSKARGCDEVGIRSSLTRFPADVREDALLGHIAALNADPGVHGVLIQPMLLARDATVTVCHSRTPDLAAFTRQADILVVAAGRPRLVTAAMVKPGAVVVDVGINRSADGRVVGDVDFEDVRRVASRVTPVPGESAR